jgi:2-phosphosulfolactate phosphatase
MHSLAGDMTASQARFVRRWEVEHISGAVVAVDVIRAFTTAAYAFGAGARCIVLVDSVEAAVAYRQAHPGVLAMGENRGLKPDGFDLSNSPVEVAAADLADRVLVQRTTAGTRGVIAARSSTRLWAASLVCASATATAVERSGLGAPTYLVTGATGPADLDARRSEGADDLAVAQFIERARTGLDLEVERTVETVRSSDEAARTLALGPGHVNPDDIAYATRVDAFDFAMELHRINGELRLQRTVP